MNRAQLDEIFLCVREHVSAEANRMTCRLDLRHSKLVVGPDRATGAREPSVWSAEVLHGRAIDKTSSTSRTQPRYGPVTEPARLRAFLLRVVRK